MRVAAAILAGGQSRRMGRDKADLPSLEDSATSMLLQTVNLAAAVFDRVYVIGRSQPEAWPTVGAGTIFLADQVPNQGPAGGLATVLKVLISEAGSEHTAVAALACDLPLLTLSSLEWLRATAEKSTSRHGVIALNGEQTEPLFAIYTQECLPLLLDQLAQGKRSLQKLIEAGDFTVVEAPPEVAATLLNVNTPEELAQVRRLVGVRRPADSSLTADPKNP
jgi:molybdopterin-guanine dinucleotide biosynthesis protein A